MHSKKNDQKDQADNQYMPGIDIYIIFSPCLSCFFHAELNKNAARTMPRGID